MAIRTLHSRGLYTLFINCGTRGRVWVEYMKARRKRLPIRMKTKQSMEMQAASLVFLEISRQLGSDSCLLMLLLLKSLVLQPQIRSYGFEVNTKKWENVVGKPHRLSQSLHCIILVYDISIHATLVSFQLKTLEAEYRNRI